MVTFPIYLKHVNLHKTRPEYIYIYIIYIYIYICVCVCVCVCVYEWCS